MCEDQEATLTKNHQTCCLLWAMKCKHVDWEEWCQVIFFDKSNFNLFGSNGHQYYWRKIGKCFLDQHVQSTVKHGEGGIMVWDCMSWKGVSKLHLIEGKINKYVYRNILEMELVGTI